jgi:hypothetical protein
MLVLILIAFTGHIDSWPSIIANLSVCCTPSTFLTRLQEQPAHCFLIIAQHIFLGSGCLLQNLYAYEFSFSFFLIAF